MLIQLHKLLDVAQCYDLLRQIRWPDGATCPTCASQKTVKNGRDTDRGVNQEKLPFCVGYFDGAARAVVYNLRKRGKHALHETFCLLLKPDLRTCQDCIIVSPI